MKHKLIPLLILLFFIFNQRSFGQNEEKKVITNYSTRINLEDRFFLNKGLYEGQEQNYLSIAAEPEFSMKWNSGKYLLKVQLFGRYDQHDERRTHADIREAYWQMVQNNHEFSIGLKKIFWGVTEAAHIVNVINQTDFVESFDGEEKLGQPMVHYSYQSNTGTYDFFVMPYFRKPVFPGINGRLRTPFLIDGKSISFESDLEEYRPDLAVRWSHYIGKFDIGLSHFYGTSRTPLINSRESFVPVFAVVNQTGLDLQATTGPVLWKFEGIYNNNSVIDYRALAAGFEYTFGNVNKKGLDIGLLSEYLFDSRDELTFSSMQNDLFAGVRFGFNDSQDTQILAGAIFDLDYGSRFFSVEGSRRVKESVTVELEGRFFNNISDKEFIHFMRRDSFLKLSVNKYF